MPPIVVVIDPMSRVTGPAEQLGLIEQPPVAIDLSPGLVLLVFVEHAMSRHDFRDILTVLTAVHKKAYAVDRLHECITLTNLPIRKELINLVAGDPLRPCLSFFDIGLKKMLARWQAKTPSLTQATISDDNLPLPMDGLRHHHHCLCSQLHVVVLHRECQHPTVGLLRSILTFDQLDPPKDRLAAIPIGNNVILIAEWVRLTGDAYEPRAKLREPRVHHLVKAIKP
jgi:hypothetical protein